MNILYLFYSTGTPVDYVKVYKDAFRIFANEDGKGKM